VLLIGSGATAVDVVLDLFHRGAGRRILMVSRKGLLPLGDVAPVAYSGLGEIDLDAPTMRGLMRLLREEIKRAAAAKIPWQSVLDAFRVHLIPIWRHSSDAERGRFLRHLRSVWLVHRHRLAPDIAELMTRLQGSGFLSVVAGRLRRADQQGAGYRVLIAERSGQQRAVAVDWIVNCAGPAERYDRLDDPLVRNLFATGRARLGPMDLGLDVDEYGQLIDARGRPQPGLYALGPPTRGRFWEITAAPWIRANAAKTAEHIEQMVQAADQRSATDTGPAAQALGSRGGNQA